MAVLSKIRERSMFLILVIGLALFAFVLDPSTLGDFFNSSKINQAGEINGETISRQEFAEAIENYQAQAGNRSSEMQASKAVWDNLVREKLYQTQLEEAGITIGEQDIMNALYQSPSVQNDPRFQTAGLFDKNKLVEYLATIKEDPKEKKVWAAWQSYISSIGGSLKKRTYDNLITSGLGASLKEGELKYTTENTKLSGQFVYIPYTSVSDSLITLKKSDIKKYISNHSSNFQVEASRDIQYVKFTVTPTQADEDAIKNNVAKLLKDREEYSTVTKGTITVPGLKNTTDYETFFSENSSDIALNKNYQFKTDLFAEVASDIIAKNTGEVYGPYKDRGYYKISKITAVTQMPDSVKASHILIPFIGSRAATADTKLIEEDAKKQADSIANVVKRNSSKFAQLAAQFSADKSNASKGGDLNWFAYNRMVPSFRDYCFSNKKGDIGVIKTPFGFHIIKIDNQTPKQKAVKLATYAQKIIPSEETENTAFQAAETFALEIANGKNLTELTKEKEVKAQTAVNLKKLDENVAGIGKQRQIIQWTFNKDTKIGDYKRFDVDNGYIVAVLTGKTKKGLMPVDKATARVRPLVLNEKKARIIEEKIGGNSLSEIAKNTNEKIKPFSNVTLGSPTISGVGNAPKIVGAMLHAKENELYNNVVGNKGVFAFVVTKKELPVALPNYDTERNRISNTLKRQTNNMYEAIKNAADIEDNRASFYGL